MGIFCYYLAQIYFKSVYFWASFSALFAHLWAFCALLAVSKGVNQAKEPFRDQGSAFDTILASTELERSFVERCGGKKSQPPPVQTILDKLFRRKKTHSVTCRCGMDSVKLSDDYRAFPLPSIRHWLSLASASGTNSFKEIRDHFQNVEINIIKCS